MSAFIIVDIEVIDHARYPEYLAKITPTVFACGGKYLVRGSNADIISGDWIPKRMVIMEFPSLDIARNWATCEENAPIHALRNAYAKANMVILEGSIDY